MADLDRTEWKVKPDGRLYVSRNGATDQQFVVRGICYQPTPAGATVLYDPLSSANRDLWRRDLPKLRAMGANAVRVYGMDSNKPLPDTHKDFLSEAWNGGVDPIYVVLSSWIDVGTFANPATDAKVQNVIRAYERLADAYGQYAAVLGFTVGSEFNPPDRNSADFAHPDYWRNFKDVIDVLRQRIGGRKIITSGLIESFAADGFLETALENDVVLDLWGFDLYRTAESFGQAWDRYAERFASTRKPFVPMLVGEFGVPASQHVGNRAAELPAGSGPQTLGAVNAYLETTWQIIEGHGIGGFVFEWSDEWWKADDDPTKEQEWRTCLTDPAGAPRGACGPSTHDASAKAADYFPGGGGFLDEEWFGLHSVTLNDRLSLHPRPAHDLLTTLWGGGQPVDGNTVTLQLPANSRIHLTGFVNTSGWWQQIDIEVRGETITWRGGGPEEKLSEVIGQRMLGAYGTAVEVKIRMSYDPPGGGVKPSEMRMAPFGFPGLNGYVVGAQDAGGRVDGRPAFWNTILFVYWAEGY